MVHPRLRLVLMTLGSLLLVGILVFVIAYDPETGGTQAPTTSLQGSIRPKAPPVDAALPDQEGRMTRVADLRGAPVIVTFMYTTCDNDCPTMTQQIRGALDRLGRDVPVIAISVDPANDTPARARAFITKQHMTGRMRFLLGDEAQLQRVWRAFGIQPQENGLEHSASVMVLDPRGVARVSFPVDRLTPEGLAHDVRAVSAAPAS
ncbi:unannotated protein [freshwater metagenome]|uniref:Unannotated protein n=1 Tax=freshwater metagenome TaxID=449393 RepID=A0A6J7IMZ1_9ZZZZ|nr:redoxin domain-containing protein [Actinomycetota bacterium]